MTYFEWYETNIETIIREGRASSFLLNPFTPTEKIRWYLNRIEMHLPLVFYELWKKFDLMTDACLLRNLKICPFFILLLLTTASLRLKNWIPLEAAHYRRITTTDVARGSRITANQCSRVPVGRTEVDNFDLMKNSIFLWNKCTVFKFAVRGVPLPLTPKMMIQMSALGWNVCKAKSEFGIPLRCQGNYTFLWSCRDVWYVRSETVLGSTDCICTHSTVTVADQLTMWKSIQYSVSLIDYSEPRASRRQSNQRNSVCVHLVPKACVSVAINRKPTNCIVGASIADF